MTNRISDLLYATVAYADIFEYPLTADDIYFWFIKFVPGKNIRSVISRIRGIQSHGQYIILTGRRNIIKKHHGRNHHSMHKWSIARKAGRLLLCIPSVKFVGVTGGLAMRNADARDDIDIFIITSGRTLWISRLLATILLDIVGWRRKPGEKHVSDKICLNMFMDEDNLCIPKDEQDLFSAHEVLQTEPIWSKGNIYKEFLHANSWVRKYLPVAWNTKKDGRSAVTETWHWHNDFGSRFMRFVEKPVGVLQQWYMRNRKTTEVIRDGMIRFHPRDARVWILQELKRRLLRKNIPLDNIFYAG